MYYHTYTRSYIICVDYSTGIIYLHSISYLVRMANAVSLSSFS